MVEICTRTANVVIGDRTDRSIAKLRLGGQWMTSSAADRAGAGENHLYDE